MQSVVIARLRRKLASPSQRQATDHQTGSTTTRNARPRHRYQRPFAFGQAATAAVKPTRRCDQEDFLPTPPEPTKKVTVLAMSEKAVDDDNVVDPAATATIFGFSCVGSQFAEHAIAVDEGSSC